LDSAYWKWRWSQVQKGLVSVEAYNIKTDKEGSQMTCNTCTWFDGNKCGAVPTRPPQKFNNPACVHYNPGPPVYMGPICPNCGGKLYYDAGFDCSDGFHECYSCGYKERVE